MGPGFSGYLYPKPGGFPFWGKGGPKNFPRGKFWVFTGDCLGFIQQGTELLFYLGITVSLGTLFNPT
ncbi:hypothetical protein JQ310_20095, partial [Leptospira interrogans]|nr:hypothetical protein [Leptospira interrogans]